MNAHLTHMFVSTQRALPRLTISQIRHDIQKTDVERILDRLGRTFSRVFIKRDQHVGGKAKALVMFENADQACAAFTDLHRLEIPELADGPLQVELASESLTGVPAQQAPIRA